MEKTLILIKPNAIQRGIMGDIITRFERKGLRFAGMKMLFMTDELVAEHYAHLVERPFFPYLKEANIPYSRLHDVGGAFSSNLYVDIPNIFRDFDADETDPANYFFDETDAVIAAQSGALGEDEAVVMGHVQTVHSQIQLITDGSGADR